MSRRGSPQVILVVAAAVVFLYGFYEYHGVKSSLRRSEEIVKRSKVEQENLSTQLQTANEQKLHLESSLQKEREEFKKSKEELLKSKSDIESKCKDDKRDLADKYRALSDDTKQIKANYESIQQELEQHKDADARHEEERARLEAENKHLKQEGDNEVAVLRDEIANLKRQNKALQSKLGGSQQKVADDTRIHGVNDNRISQMGQDAGNVDDKFDNPMQINKPGDNVRKPYFEPKEAKPDHPVVNRVTSHSGGANNAVDQPDDIHGQVVPPDVGNNPNNEVVEQQDHLKRGAKVQLSDENAHAAVAAAPFHANPIALPSNELGGVAAPRVVHNADQLPARSAGGVASKKFGHGDSRAAARLGFGGGGGGGVGINQHNAVDSHGGQKQKQLQIAEPHLQNEEENQLQGPHNDRNADEKEDDDNEEDYQYEDKKDKVEADADKVQNDGPHAGPVDEDDIAKEPGL